MSSLSRLILLVLLFGLLACSKNEPTMNVQVQVQRQKEAGVWRVSYETSEAIEALDFVRQRYNVRAKSWKTITEGVEIVRSGQTERIVASRPIKKFEFEFAERQTIHSNDYSIVSHYSDGAAVFYTGHLLLKLPECSKCQVLHEFSYSSPGENIISEDNHLELGDFVYFGQNQIIEYDSFRAVVDQGLPDWIERQIERSFPAFVTHYQARLGFQLENKPLVFIGYDTGALVTQEAYQAGVVGSHIQLILKGLGWNQPTGATYEKFAHVVAHEVFHLWNGARFLAPDRTGGSWLHEGGADAIADYVLYELGYYDANRFSAVQTERLNRCMMGITRKSLPESDQTGHYRNFYDCGAVMNHLVARKLPGGLTLFDFWKSLFQSSSETFYTQEGFFAATSSIVADPNLQIALGRLTVGQTGAPDRFFEETFDSLGLGYSVRSDSYPDWYQNLSSEHVVELLAERDCGTPIPTDVVVTGVTVQSSETCSSFRASREIRTVSGRPVPSDGVGAYDNLTLGCAYNPVATVSDSSGNSYSTTCHDFPRRPAFIQW